MTLLTMWGLPGTIVKAWHGAKAEPYRQMGVIPPGDEDVGSSVVDGVAQLEIPAGCEALAFVIDGSQLVCVKLLRAPTA